MQHYQDQRDDIMAQMDTLIKTIYTREEARKSGMDNSAYQLGYLVSAMSTIIAKMPVKQQKFVVKELAETIDWVKTHPSATV